MKVSRTYNTRITMTYEQLRRVNTYRSIISCLDRNNLTRKSGKVNIFNSRIVYSIVVRNKEMAFKLVVK